MKANQKPLLFFLVCPLLGLIAYLLWPSSPARAADAKTRKVFFYQDSMHPWVKSDHPGKCTICGMDLTPIAEGEKAFGISSNLVVLSSNGITVLNVQTEPVKRRPLRRSLRVAGTLEANETTKTVVSAPARGRIDGVAVDYAGVEVEKGEKLITFFSPELVQLRWKMLVPRLGTRGTNVTEGTSAPEPYTGYITAPLSGVVLDRTVYLGQYVAEGDRLLVIADASVLWFRFDVYERQLPWFEVGQAIEIETPGVPGKVFPAVISFVEPIVNDATRTVKVRAEVCNPLVEINGHKRRLLKYGMYAEARVRSEVPEVLAIPRTAILSPGDSACVYVEKGDGAYERRRVKLGRQGDGLWEVLNGLEEGDRVVTSGSVLIDAQAQFTQEARPEAPEVEEVAVPELAAVENPTGEVMSHPTGTAGMSTMQRPNEEPQQMTTPPPTPLAAKQPNAEPPTSATQPASARITQFKTAAMSRGAEPQATLWAAITKAGGNQVPEGTPVAASQRMASVTATPGQTPSGVSAKSGKAELAMEHNTVPVVTQSEATQAKLPAMAPLSQVQSQQLKALVKEADAISVALAADDLRQFNLHAARLPDVVSPVQKELAAPRHWEGMIERMAALAKEDPAKDLTEARKRFLPFSTALVEWARQLRKDAPALPTLRVYHCPMAPKPGLWVQINGPLANPFYGKKMLNCGEEVTE